ncbi:MAG: hypothetical protein IAF38_22420 [Bacteroidia bacterium]|nr:hypothetical protein [Bacteroidia bacterium]
MIKQLITQQAEYNLWANTKFAELLKDEPVELLNKEIKSSFHSINKTLFHIWDAEFIWLERLNGRSLNSFPSKEKDAQFSFEGMLKTSKDLLKLIELAEENYFLKETTYRNIKGDEFTSVNQGILLHVFNHGTFHRGQVVTMLRGENFSNKIDSTDLISFLREK